MESSFKNQKQFMLYLIDNADESKYHSIRMFLPVWMFIL